MGRGAIKTNDMFGSILGIKRGRGKEAHQERDNLERKESALFLLGPHSDEVLGILALLDDLSSPKLLKQANKLAIQTIRFEPESRIADYLTIVFETEHKSFAANSMLMVQKKAKTLEGYNNELLALAQRSAIAMAAQDSLNDYSFKTLTKGFKDIYAQVCPERFAELSE